MAALAHLQQEVFDFRNGRFISVTLVQVTNAADTVTLPEGVGNSAHVVVLPVNSSDTAKTVSSITQSAHPAGCTVNLSAAGTNGSQQLVIALHNGAASGL